MQERGLIAEAMASASTTSSDEEITRGLIPQDDQQRGRRLTIATLLTSVALGCVVWLVMAKPFTQTTRNTADAMQATEAISQKIQFRHRERSMNGQVQKQFQKALPPNGLGAQPEEIFVSGLSSGADFAAQFQVAYSAKVSGAAIFAGQPFRCAITRFQQDELQPPNPQVPICVGCPPDKTLMYDHCKHEPSWVDVSELKAVVDQDFRAGVIDDPANLKRSGVYCYRGTVDSHYAKGSVAKTAEFFEQFASSPDNVKLVDDVPSGHAYPLPGTCPWPCGKSALANTIPFQNCEYDGFGEALKHIYSTLGKQIKTPTRASEWNWDSLLWFDQEPFWDNRSITRLEKHALVYVPKNCAPLDSPSKNCNLMVNFHGCGFVFPGTYEMLVTQLNLNAWAEANDIVVLYPRLGAIGSTAEQKQGCWNVYGQTGKDYATKNAPQMNAIWKMATSLTNLKMVGYFNPTTFEASEIADVLKTGLCKAGKAVQKKLLEVAQEKMGRTGKIVVKRVEKRLIKKVKKTIKELCDGKLKEKMDGASLCAAVS